MTHGPRELPNPTCDYHRLCKQCQERQKAAQGGVTCVQEMHSRRKLAQQRRPQEVQCTDRIDAHLDINAVELIKARKRAALRDPAEEERHEVGVEGIPTVEHDRLSAQRLSKILHPAASVRTQQRVEAKQRSVIFAFCPTQCP